MDKARSTSLATDRILLRRWRMSDRAPFALVNADPAVVEFLPASLARAESDAMIGRIEAHFDKHGFGLFAAELRETSECIGYIGLAIPDFQAAFTPCVEIGWRLSSAHWDRGLATEGARAVVRYAFQTLGLPALVSFTVPANLRSRRVMEKLSMTHDPCEDFSHPRLPADHRLSRHMLCRLANPMPAAH